MLVLNWLRQRIMMQAILRKVQMVEAIARDKKRVLPCAAWLEGEYGLDGLFLGVPCKLGATGLEGVIEVKLSDAEREALGASAEAVRGTMELVQL